MTQGGWAISRGRVSAARVAALLLPVLTAFLAAAPATAERLDLTRYVAPEPLSGDWKAFALDDGVNRRLDFVSVAPWKKNGWRAVGTWMEDDLPSSTATQFVLPGKKLLLGGISSAELSIVFSRPQRQLRLLLEPGRIERFKMSGRALLAGQDIGRGKFAGTYQLVGFELVETPMGSYPDAARIDVAASLIVKARANGNVVEAREQLTNWYVEDLGVVAGEESLSLYVNGVLMETIGPREGSLVDGVWRGAPIFP